MHNLKVAIVQTQQFWERKQDNLKHFDELLVDLDDDVDIITFPEMFHTGFTMNVKGMGESMEDSVGIEWLRKVAKEKSAAVCASLIIREHGYFYNRFIFITPDNKLFHYDKNQLFTLAKEDDYFTPGNHLRIIDYKGWKLKLQVCYDLRFPENVRNNVDEKGKFEYDAIIYLANWPERRAEHWKTLIKARAIENQVYVIACNRVGEDANDIKYCGDSMLVNALGDEVVSSNSEEILYGNMIKEELRGTRERFAFLKDRIR